MAGRGVQACGVRGEQQTAVAMVNVLALPQRIPIERAEAVGRGGIWARQRRRWSALLLEELDAGKLLASGVGGVVAREPRKGIRVEAVGRGGGWARQRRPWWATPDP